MVKTTLKNNAKFSVQVKEGNSNIFSILGVMKPGKSMIIKADSKAIYREYVLILLPDNKKLRPLSAADIQEFRAIEIFGDKDEVDWKGVEKKSWFDSLLGRSSPNPDEPEDPKQKDPKQEDPKQEEPKQEDPKQEDPKQEDPKQEDPKQEEPKQEEPKQEEPKQEDPKQEDPKQEDPKQEDPKQEDPKQEDPKQEDP